MKELYNKEILSLLEQAFATFSKSADKLSAVYTQLNRENVISPNNIINVPLELLYGVMECISDGVIIVDKDGTILYANDVALNLSGLELFDILNRSYREVFNDDTILKAIETDETIYFKKQINNGCWSKAFAKPITNNNAIGAIEIVGPFADSTSDNLNGDDFSDYLVKLSKIVSDIIINIVHRMRSPLSAIQLFAELLKDDIDIEKKEMVQDILASVYSIEAILSNLSSSVQAIMPNIKKLDIIGIIEESLNVAYPAIKQQGIRLIKRYADDQMFCWGDIEQLKQVYFNIILNAIQAMSEGGELNIIATYSDDLKYIDIEISDNGCGIPDALIERLFTPFFTTKEGGTGLGLYVAYRIMQVHKGKIRINSVRHKGTTVFIKMPIDIGNIS